MIRVLLPAAVVLLLLGYFRDYIFININFLSGVKYYPNIETDYKLPSQLSFLNSFTYEQLYFGKFFVTLLFLAAFLLVSIVVIKKLFTDSKYIKWTVYAYISLVVLSGIFYSYGMLFDDFNTGYKLSRVFMGFLQSPFVLMVLVPAFKIAENNNSQ
jgi:hypothetical protein